MHLLTLDIILLSREKYYQLLTMTKTKQTTINDDEDKAGKADKADKADKEDEEDEESYNEHRSDECLAAA